MLIDNLYEKILIEPSIVSDAKKLFIVSGYATPAMVLKHMQETSDIEVNLLIGMAKNGGISAQKHNVFQQMVSEAYYGRFF